ncbi:hypothetical protein [Bradyrhizobium lablabi]|uniref:hypothetical protein n=1 Tax=Bradyrhizobium lablabi TaxID=722472 RepID=UPI000AC0A253|nr:hypothetical protein [Bradyrhizobium lablabi]
MEAVAYRFSCGAHHRGNVRTFAERMPGVPLLANVTAFGKTPFLAAAEFEITNQW